MGEWTNFVVDRLCNRFFNPSDLPARIQEALVRVYGSEITTVFTQNPSLIGGLRIQVGCDVYDGSVRSRLATLKTSFGIAPERKESHPI